MNVRMFLLRVARRLDVHCESSMRKEVRAMRLPMSEVREEDVYFALFRALGEIHPLPKLYTLLKPTEKYPPCRCANLLERITREHYVQAAGLMNVAERKRRFSCAVRQIFLYFIMSLLNGLHELMRQYGPSSQIHHLSLTELQSRMQTEIERLRFILDALTGRVFGADESIILIH